MNDVKQVDREAAATLEPNNGYERDQILRGKRNKGAIVQILAAHRIAAEAAKDAEYADKMAALQARVAELEGEYICKCGVRVEPHKCRDTGGGF